MATKKPEYTCRIVWDEKKPDGSLVRKSFPCLDRKLALWHTNQMQKSPGVILNIKVDNI